MKLVGEPLKKISMENEAQSGGRVVCIGCARFNQFSNPELNVHFQARYSGLRATSISILCITFYFSSNCASIYF